LSLRDYYGDVVVRQQRVEFLDGYRLEEASCVYLHEISRRLDLSS